MNKRTRSFLAASLLGVWVCAALGDTCYDLVLCSSTYHGPGECIPAPSGNSAWIPAGDVNPEGWIIGSFACGVVKIGGILTPIPCGPGLTIDTCI